VRAYRFDRFEFDPDAIALARQSLAQAGMLVVGEPHGVCETPGVLSALASLLGTRAVAFEWSHEEMDEPVQDWMRVGCFDFERLWSLPSSAEFFCGDGRITPGHFALLQQLRDESRLDQVIVFDRLDPEPPNDNWEAREREMAARLWPSRMSKLPLLVLTPMPGGSIVLRIPEGSPAVVPGRDRP
jgi:hypothetical protein